MSAPQAIAIDALASRVAQGERPALAQALNLLDDTRETAREQAGELLALLQRSPSESGAHLIGITGPPGVGKSTLGAALIKLCIDEYTRECLCIHVDRKINARKVRTIMARLIEEHGAPESIRSDNGSEFIEKQLRKWMWNNQIKTIYIEPGSPWQNGYIESFNARLREECLDREQLWTLTEARVVLEDWRWKYNNIRPHRSLGYVTPLKFAQQEFRSLPSPRSDQHRASSRPTASLRLGIDFLYNLNYKENLFRLTNPVAQFG